MLHSRFMPTRLTPTKSTPTRSTPTRSTSHNINSHDINSHEVNSHQINFPRHQLPRHQLPWGQLPPDQLLIKVMKCDSVWVNVGSRGVSLQRIVHFKEMHHFKHYLVINHCHIWISKIELVVVGRHSWLKQNLIPIFLRSSMWCERSKVPRMKPMLCSLLEKENMCRKM